MDNQQKLLGITQAAKILGVHPLTVRNWTDKGHLPYFRTPGGHRRFRQEDLEAFLIQINRNPSTDVAMVAIARQAVKAALIANQTEDSNLSWQRAMPDNQRDAMRSIGRNLLGLVIQYVAGTADEVILKRGRQIGHTYGSFARQQAMSISETVATFNFFRDTIIDATFEASAQEAGLDASNPQLYQRLNYFMNEVLLATVQSAEQTGDQLGDGESSKRLNA
jgi:excisionase family DNA binding protein